TCQAAEPSGAAALQAQACVVAREAEVKRGEGVHRAYRHHLEPLSLRVHPGWLWASTCQSAADVERQLRAEIAAIETLVETQAWPGKQKALHQVRRPLAALSAVVDFWWQGGWQDFQPVAMTPLWKRGVDEVLLPLRYGQEQGSRPRGPQRKARGLQALQAV